MTKLYQTFVGALLPIVILAVSAAAQTGPAVDFGRAEYERAAEAAGMDPSSVRVDVAADLSGHEAFEIRVRDGAVTIRGSDNAGILYGFLELTEQIALAPDDASLADALHDASGRPHLEQRGMARVLTAEDGNLSPWFRDRPWWENYLDDLARNRFNLLELEGVYRVDERTYANALPYFIDISDTEYESPSDAEKQANLESLAHVVDYAGRRGIGVAFVNTRVTIKPDNLIDDYAHIGRGIDANVDFDWIGEGPLPELGIDHYAIQWTGVIVPPKTGEYTFATQADDGTRLWVDGRQIIDDWNISGIVERTGTVRLEKGKAYPIRLEYLEWMYAAVVRLLWTPPGGEQEAIPAEVLFHGDSREPGLQAHYYTRQRYSVELTRHMTAALVEAVPGLDLFGVRGPHLEHVENDLLFGTYSDADELLGMGPLYARLDPEAGQSDTVKSVRFNGDLLVESEPQDSEHWYFQRDVSAADENTLWRLGTSGTVRLFRWFDPLFARITVTHPAVERSAGLVVEAIGAHTPQDTARFYRDPSAAGVESMADRHGAFRLVWGRLAYNSEETEDLFRRLFQQHYGEEDGALLYDRLVKASRVLPQIQATLTSDINNTGQPPEFTFRSRIDADIYSRVFNERSYRRVPETVQLYLGESPEDGRRTSLEAAEELGVLGEALTENAGADSAEARDVLDDTRLVGLLAHYHDQRLRSLVDLQAYFRTNNYHYLETASTHLLSASEFWAELSEEAVARYRPFPEPLGMGPEFTWANQQRFIQRDLDRLAMLEAELAGVAGPQIGHLPYHSAYRNRDLEIGAGVLGDNRVDVELEYKTSPDSKARRVNMKRQGQYGVFATIPAKRVEGESLHYRIVAERGDRQVTWPYSGWQQVDVVPEVE